MRGVVVVTYVHRQDEPGVRFLPPHPVFLFLLLLPLFCVSALAVEPAALVEDADTVEYYSSSRDVPLFYVLDPPLTGSNWSGTLFGTYWEYRNDLITRIGNQKFTGRADGVQELATALFDMAIGVDARIDQIDLANNSTVIDILNDIKSALVGSSGLQYWLSHIYDSVQSNDGKLQNLYQQFDRLFAKLDAQYKSFQDYFLVPVNGWYLSPSGQSLAFSASSLAGYFRHFSAGITNIFRYPGFHISGSGSLLNSSTSFSNIVSSGFTGLANLMLGNASHDIYGLSSSGHDKTGKRGDWSLADISANGFSGLATLIAGYDESTGRKALLTLTDLDDLSEGTYEASSLFDILSVMGSALQKPLARLAYVYASEDDIIFKDEEQDNEDAVKDDFFGDGDAAVSPGDIKDAAGITSGIKDTFGGAGSSGDIFTVLSDENSWWFFSQEVADALDIVNAPAAAALSDDDPLDGFVADEAGFYSVSDTSPWDVTSYLGGFD